MKEDSKLVEVEVPPSSPLRVWDAERRPSIMRFPSIKIRFTNGGELEVVVRETIYFPVFDKDPLCLKDQEEHRDRVEKAVREYLAKTLEDPCFLDCGDIGECKGCVHYWGYDPKLFTVYDLYRKQGEYRRARDEEIKDAIFDQGFLGGLFTSVSLFLAARSLKASTEDISRVYQEMGMTPG